MRHLLQVCPPDFAVYSGDDATACEAILMGAKGDISVTANVAPALMNQMSFAALAGDSSTARELNARMSRPPPVVCGERNPLPPQWALIRKGLHGPRICFPFNSKQ